jgi:hypothetical protein
MIKKIAKALDEMSKNDELMAGILAATGDDQDNAGDQNHNENNGD